MSNKNILPYDPKSADSIFDYGMLLFGHSLRELHPNAKIFKGKGGLGTSVEYYHYEYEPNSEVEPDFAEAGLEGFRLLTLKFGISKSLERYVVHKLILTHRYE